MSVSARPNGKVAIVTGANSGIGRVTACELARKGWHVFLACRSVDKTAPVLAEIAASGGRAEYLPLDLGDFISVNACADAFIARGLPLHLLVCNAGLSGQKGMTASGFELTFGVCHMGHFLLTLRLQDTLTAAGRARVVVVASKMHRWSRLLDLSRVKLPTESPGGLREYSQTKLANILFATELAIRMQSRGVTTYAVHPGIVATDVWRAVPAPIARLIKRLMITPEEGARTTLYCATAPEVAEESGRYYADCRAIEPAPAAQDRLAARRLWEASEQWLRVALASSWSKV